MISVIWQLKSSLVKNEIKNKKHKNQKIKKQNENPVKIKEFMEYY